MPFIQYNDNFMLQVLQFLPCPSVPNYCQSVCPKQATLEEDWELSLIFSSILCLWFDIQGRRTDNFFDWVLNTACPPISRLTLLTKLATEESVQIMLCKPLLSKMYFICTDAITPRPWCLRGIVVACIHLSVSSSILPSLSVWYLKKYFQIFKLCMDIIKIKTPFMEARIWVA